MAQLDDIAVCGLVVRPQQHVVIAEGSELNLTCREFEIVSKLAQHPGWVLSTEQLATGTEFGDYSPESVSVIVSRLRQKLARAGLPDVVETVRGVGYRLHQHADDVAALRATASLSCGRLRDASWELQEAVIEVEHSGAEHQRQAAIDALEQARRAIYTSLAE